MNIIIFYICATVGIQRAHETACRGRYLTPCRGFGKLRRSRCGTTRLREQQLRWS